MSQAKRLRLASDEKRAIFLRMADTGPILMEFDTTGGPAVPLLPNMQETKTVDPRLRSSFI